jgi:hypothetical protein
MKRQIIMVSLSVLILLILIGCRRENGVGAPPASLNIINAIPTSNPVIPVLGTSDTIQFFGTAQSISYPGSFEYSPPAGSNLLYIVQNEDTARLDLKQTLFNGTLDLMNGGIYSFFLAGDTSSPDTMLIKDNIPTYTDSSAGVRFVNLSTGSLPMSVNIQGNSPTQMEFSALGYKGVSSFNKYLANSGEQGEYTFEVRDQGTGNLLTTFTWYYTLFRNNTLVISGSEALGAIQILQVNNY